MKIGKLSFVVHLHDATSLHFDFSAKTGKKLTEIN